jgi:hypothetical protein
MQDPKPWQLMTFAMCCWALAWGCIILLAIKLFH